MINLRTKATSDRYKAFRGKIKPGNPCRCCAETLPDKKYSFVHWKILHNNFPYDSVTKAHDMLIPKRHFETEDQMTDEERKELSEIKTHILPEWKEYHSFMENFMSGRTVPHYHIHLLTFKD